MKFKTIQEAVSAVTNPLPEGWEGLTISSVDDGTFIEVEEGSNFFVVSKGELKALTDNAVFIKDGNAVRITKLEPSTREERGYADHFKYMMRGRNKALRIQAIQQKIARHIGSRGSIDESNKLLIGGKLVWDLEIREDRGHSGKFSVTVGDYGNRRRFPERKDGSHNYLEIADALCAAQYHRIARENSYNRRNTNETAVKALRETAGYGYEWSVEATDNLDNPVKVSRTVSFIGTVDQAQKFLAAVNKLLADLAKPA